MENHGHGKSLAEKWIKMDKDFLKKRRWLHRRGRRRRGSIWLHLGLSCRNANHGVATSVRICMFVSSGWFFSGPIPTLFSKSQDIHWIISRRCFGSARRHGSGHTWARSQLLLANRAPTFACSTPFIRKATVFMLKRRGISIHMITYAYAYYMIYMYEWLTNSFMFCS